MSTETTGLPPVLRLPQSSVDLTWDAKRGGMGQGAFCLMWGKHSFLELSLDVYVGKNAGVWQARVDSRGYHGTKDECIAWLDEKVLILRALIAPGVKLSV